MTDHTAREMHDVSIRLPTRFQIGDAVTHRGRRGNVSGIAFRTNTKFAAKHGHAHVYYVVRFEENRNLSEIPGHELLPA